MLSYDFMVEIKRSSTPSEIPHRVKSSHTNLHFNFPLWTLLSICMIMMSSMGNGTEENIDRSNRLVNAKMCRHGWNSDLLALSKFVKEQVFYVVVHDFKNESDDPLDANHGAVCQNLYLKKFPKKVINIHMMTATQDEMTVYLKDLWTTALNRKGRGNIRRELSSEKSAVYSALNDSFRSKFATE